MFIVKTTSKISTPFGGAECKLPSFIACIPLLRTALSKEELRQIYKHVTPNGVKTKSRSVLTSTKVYPYDETDYCVIFFLVILQEMRKWRNWQTRQT